MPQLNIAFPPAGSKTPAGCYSPIPAEEAKALEMTVTEVMAWKPPEKGPGGGKRRGRKVA